MLQSLQPGSYLERYSRESNLIGKSFSYKCNTALGHFDDLLSIVLNETESDCERASKRARLDNTDSIDQHILKLTGLESKKMIFYPVNQTVSACTCNFNF